MSIIILVDSQIVHVMIQNETYGFNTFAATRVGEIQEGTSVTDWYWIQGEYNIADWLTRGKSAKDIGMDSVWQKGPEFLRKPESEWPISQDITEQQLPDTIKQGTANAVKQQYIAKSDNLATHIGIQKYSNYKKLLKVTVQVLAMYKTKPKVTFKNVAAPLM